MLVELIARIVFWNSSRRFALIAANTTGETGVGEGAVNLKLGEKCSVEAHAMNSAVAFVVMNYGG